MIDLWYCDTWLNAQSDEDVGPMKATTSYKSSRGNDAKQGCGSSSCWGVSVTLLILLQRLYGLDDNDDDNDDGGACISYEIIDDDTVLRLQVIIASIVILMIYLEYEHCMEYYDDGRRRPLQFSFSIDECTVCEMWCGNEEPRIDNDDDDYES